MIDIARRALLIIDTAGCASMINTAQSALIIQYGERCVDDAIQLAVH